jgi:DUF1365 family protein
VTHKTIAAIHLHALRLWLRGVRFHRRAPAGATQKHSEATR